MAPATLLPSYFTSVWAWHDPRRGVTFETTSRTKRFFNNQDANERPSRSHFVLSWTEIDIGRLLVGRAF
jgi:hypothetical protein